MDLTFAALAPNGGVTTLAYWLGVTDTASLKDIDAVSISRAMAYQYDTEEQADRTGMVMPDDVDWREHFAPVAPVQLTRAWSPLPYTSELLGPPTAPRSASPTFSVSARPPAPKHHHASAPRPRR